MPDASNTEATMGIVRAIVLLGLAAAIAAPAEAGGDPRDRYAPCCIDAQEYDWSGFFLGGHAALAISQIDWDFTGPSGGTEHIDNVFAGGLHAAFQRQWGSLVAGVEVSFSWLNAEDTTSLFLPPGTNLSSSINDLLIVSGKLGYAHERWLAFAKVGYASVGIELRCSTCTASTSDREHGWMMGMGIDYALTDKVIVGLEYDWSFYSFDTRSLDAVQAGGNADIQTLMARLMFKFGTGYGAPFR
jgi:outer membrane immunogenic protein